MKTALVTGAVGFIGFFTCLTLLKSGWRVVGIDSMNEYYDVLLKKQRENELLKWQNYQSIHKKIEEPLLLSEIFQKERPEIVIHLAAQAGVRYSIENPRAYLQSNIIGTFELLEAARAFPPEHMLLASTSSAYGANTNMPYCEVDRADHQISFYAATKKSTENIAHSYAHLFNLPITMFRFFTVYGPWGRPDMALFKFTKNILENKKIDLFNNGNQTRDFVYIDDVVECIILSVSKIPRINRKWFLKKPNPKSSYCPYRLINVGSDNPTKLSTFIRLIEMYLGKKSKQKNLPFQKSDIIKTESSSQWCYEILKYKPKIKPTVGIKHFLDWYKNYYQ